MDEIQRQLEPIWRRCAETGDPLIGESALAELLGISRPKLREALAQLEHAGVLDRRQGAPTMVNPSVLDIDFRMEQRLPFANAVESRGSSGRRELLDWDIAPSRHDVAKDLQTEVGAQTIRVTHRWTADEVPVRYGQVHVLLKPGFDVEQVTSEQLEPDDGISQLVEHIWGERARWERMTPSSVSATKTTSEELACRKGAPLLRTDTVGVTRSGRRVYTARNWYTSQLRLGLIRSISPTPTAFDNL